MCILVLTRKGESAGSFDLCSGWHPVTSMISSIGPHSAFFTLSTAFYSLDLLILAFALATLHGVVNALRSACCHPGNPDRTFSSDMSLRVTFKASSRSLAFASTFSSLVALHFLESGVLDQSIEHLDGRV